MMVSSLLKGLQISFLHGHILSIYGEYANVESETECLLNVFAQEKRKGEGEAHDR